MGGDTTRLGLANAGQAAVPASTSRNVGILVGQGGQARTQQARRQDLTEPACDQIGRAGCLGGLAFEPL